MKNVILFIIVNIDVYAKIYQNIPLSSRDRAIFTFSEFESRQRLGQSQMTFDNLLGYILKSYKMLTPLLRNLAVLVNEARCQGFLLQWKTR